MSITIHSHISNHRCPQNYMKHYGHKGKHRENILTWWRKEGAKRHRKRWQQLHCKLISASSLLADCLKWSWKNVTGTCISPPIVQLIWAFVTLKSSLFPLIFLFRSKIPSHCTAQIRSNTRRDSSPMAHHLLFQRSWPAPSLFPALSHLHTVPSLHSLLCKDVLRTLTTPSTWWHR